MARILAEGTGARSAVVWLKVGTKFEAEAAWPVDDSPVDEVSIAGDEFPDLGATLALPVLHRDELLGALSLVKPPGERLTPAEEHLARDLASGAGLVLRNVRLTEELLARLEDLRASRQRIVAAQDAERRKLERNIHDGAQQQLVALAVRLRLAKQLLVTDPERASRMLEDVEHDTTEALADLRDLARGIYPPLLADQGLVAALSAQARKASLPVQIDADEIARYSPEQEAGVYFCILEALQNVAKYAGASRAVIRLSESNGYVAFDVSDDGRGFDQAQTAYGTGLQGMADRLNALGGELDVRSQPGRGTTVTGRLPARTLEPAR
jgi:signal transduction histidine kinase